MSGPVPRQRARSLTLPPELSSPAAARRLVREVLAEAGRGDWSEAAELAVSELVANVALHAHTTAEVRVLVDPARARVEVRDGSPMLPDRRSYDAQATTGRGLALVGLLASDYGVTSLGEQGKVVWFEVDGGAVELDGDDLLAAWSDSHWALDPVGDQPEPPARPAGSRVVRLRSTPAALWLAARQHHDALLRELALYLAEHGDVDVDLARAGLARGTVTAAVGDAVLRADRDAGTHPGDGGPAAWVAPAPLDLELTIPAELGSAYAALQDALDAAERLARAGRMLVRPGLPEIVAVRDWVCEQVQSQLLGVAPSSWPGTEQARFDTASPAPVDEPLRELAAGLAAGRAYVAVDEANRIVGISGDLASAVGWDVEELVGRRVVALVPRRLREAHVAGFTRHLTTGEAHLLGTPLELPVLCADGSELACRVLLEQADVDGRQVLYLAWIEPLG